MGADIISIGNPSAPSIFALAAVWFMSRRIRYSVGWGTSAAFAGIPAALSVVMMYAGLHWAIGTAIILAVSLFSYTRLDVPKHGIRLAPKAQWKGIKKHWRACFASHSQGRQHSARQGSAYARSSSHLHRGTNLISLPPTTRSPPS